MTAVFDFGMVWFSPRNAELATDAGDEQPETSNQPALRSPHGEAG